MDKKYPKMKKSECYKTVRIYDLLDIGRYMYQNGYGDLGSTIWCMFPEFCNKGNDSYWELLRSWITNDKGREIFDLIAKVFHFPEDEIITFWVSW